MNLRKLQDEAKIWRSQNFPPDKRDAVHQALGVSEETGELAHAVLKLSQGIRGDKEKHLIEAADAVGDIVVYLSGVCDALGLDLAACVSSAWMEVMSRDWKERPETG